MKQTVIHFFYSKDEQLTSYVEFKAQKFSPRHENGVTKRLLCLSETCIIERDAPTYYAICARPLKTVCFFYLLLLLLI